MIMGVLRSLVLVLVAVTGHATAAPAPRDDFDMPDVYSTVFPRNELNNFKYFSQYHTTGVSTAKSPQIPLQIEDQHDDTSVNTQVEDEMETNILNALLDIETFAKMLDADAEYIENRKKEDPSWPNSITRKIESKVATEDEERVFKEDMERSASFIVLMKMMELRLTLVNEYIQQTIADNPNADLSTLFGKAENLPIMRVLFQMKYFEGLLHSVNSMVEETLTEESSNSVLPAQVITPGENEPNTDFVFDFATLMVLLFTVIGFFFVLFLCIYLVLKVVRNCLEKGSDYDKKSKYERI